VITDIGRVAVAISLALLVISCSEVEDPSRDYELIPVPEPSLAGLHPRIADQLQSQHEMLSKISLNNPASRDISRRYGVAGQTYHTYEFLEAAEACYLNAQHFGVDDYRWSYYLGRIYVEQGQAEAAVQQFRHSLELNPQYLPTAISLAETLRKANRIREATAILEEILANEPKYAMAHYLLGQVLLDRGDSLGAVRSLQVALAAQPGATRIHYLLATAYRDIGDVERAQYHLNLRGDGQFRFSDPLMSELARFNRGAQRDLEAGAEAFRRGDFASAARHFREATVVGLGNNRIDRGQGSALLAEAHHALGAALEKLGNPGEAETHYLEALQLKPDFVAVHYNLALLQDLSGRFEEAIAHYEQALKIEPRYRDARFRLASDLEQIGHCGEVFSHVDLVLEWSPESKPARELQTRCQVVTANESDDF